MKCEKCWKEMQHLARWYYGCDCTKQPTLTSDLSREEKIKKIYETIKTTCFWFTSQDWWYTGNNIEYIMIWDVLDWVVKSDDTQNIVEYKHIDICRSWDFKRQPIENQSDSCIDFIYSLI